MKGKKIITVISIVCLLSILLVIPAFATVMDSSGDGFALYNGIKLPNIDSVWTDKATYPYGCMVSADGIGILYLTDYQFTFDGEQIVKPAGGYFAIYAYANDVDAAASVGIPVGEWAFVFEGADPNTFVSVVMDWSNYDILNTAGNVYFAASNPIPLDGMNIIEWDGDTTGLEKDGSSYRVYDSIDPTSTVSVRINADNSLTVGTFLEHFAEVGMWTCGLNVEEFPFAFGGDDIGTFFMKETGTPNNPYCSLLAYRTVEAPPDEGGGDEDDPQPPCGG